MIILKAEVLKASLFYTILNIELFNLCFGIFIYILGIVTPFS